MFADDGCKVVTQEFAGARASFEPRHGKTRQASTSFVSQAQQGGRRLKSQPTGISQRYAPTHCHPGQEPRRLPEVSIRRLRCPPHADTAATVRNGIRGAADAGRSRDDAHPGASVSVAETLIGRGLQTNLGSP
jgi:hypothetical protein